MTTGVDARTCKQNAGSRGSLAKADDNKPTLLSSPAGWRMTDTEAETLFMKNIGFQPRSWTLRIACTANGGRVAGGSALQPRGLSSTNCRSIEGSLNS